MTSVENSTQSPSGTTFAVQNPETHAAMLHQSEPKNGNRDPATLVPGMADLIDLDADPEEDVHDSADGINDRKHGMYVPPPGIEDARCARRDLQKILKSNQKTGPGHVDLDSTTRERLGQVCQFLWNYLDPDTTAHGGTAGSSWKAASEQTAHAIGKGDYLARNLWKWARAFIINREDLPIKSSGQWKKSWLDDKILAQEITSHLQGIGKYADAMDIVRFLDTPEMKERLKLEKTIHPATAKRWMHKMGYHWGNAPKGQYVDGHEREDTVAYRKDVFLAKLAEVDPKTRQGTNDDPNVATIPDIRHTVVWYHDESTFYANDR